MSDNNQDKKQEKFTQAYERMLERSKDFLTETTHAVAPQLQKTLDTVTQIASDVGELSREEAERVAGTLVKQFPKGDMMSDALFWVAIHAFSEILGHYVETELNWPYAWGHELMNTILSFLKGVNIFLCT